MGVDLVHKILTNLYFVAIGIPVMVLVSGAFLKKVARGASWQRQDFYLGIPSTFTAFTGALLYNLYLINLLKLGQQSDPFVIANNLWITGIFIIVVFFNLLGLLGVHQSWQHRTDRAKAQFIMLGVLSNLWGSFLLFAFVIIVKGIK